MIEHTRWMNGKRGPFSLHISPRNGIWYVQREDEKEDTKNIQHEE